MPTFYHSTAVSERERERDGGVSLGTSERSSVVFVRPVLQADTCYPTGLGIRASLGGAAASDHLGIPNRDHFVSAPLSRSIRASRFPLSLQEAGSGSRENTCPLAGGYALPPLAPASRRQKHLTGPEHHGTRLLGVY